MTHTLVVLPGDGIGPWVIDAALEALEAVGAPFEPVFAEVGWSCWRRDGNPLPEATVTLLRTHGLGLFGAITSRPAAEAEAALPKALQGTGRRYVSPVLALRRRLGLEVAIRPVASHPDRPGQFVRLQRPGDAVERPEIRAAVVMQNTLGHYAGVGFGRLDPTLRAALSRHPEMAPLADLPDEDLSLSCRIVSRAASLRVARAALDYAAAQGHRRLTVVDKWGVLTETADPLLEAARQAHAEHPARRQITLDHENLDTLLLHLVRRPERYGVLLATALVGDLVSDLLAGLTGGLGYAPCANLGPRCALFEPVHGSAPHLRSRPERVNATAAVLAAALLCDHVGAHEAAAALRARYAGRHTPVRGPRARV